MSSARVCVILAGGAGTRFWPASTDAHPKQFLPLTSSQSLLRESFERARTLTSDDKILVLTAARYVPEVARDLPELAPDQILGEPCRRDTAAAVALAALVVAARFGDDAVMAMLTADHHIAPTAAFTRVIGAALDDAAREDALFCFGIAPTHPATGYGYLKLAAARDTTPPSHVLERFVEKPDAKTAAGYVEDGGYAWNSGMFAWRAAVILDAFRDHLPAHLETLAPALDDEGGLDQLAFAAAFADLERISVDYAILERAPRVIAYTADFAWSDVGGFAALAPFLAKDDDDNAHRGQLFVREARDNLVFSLDERESVALIGVEGLVVVRAGGRTLVCPRDRLEEIKALVADLPVALREGSDR